MGDVPILRSKTRNSEGSVNGYEVYHQTLSKRNLLWKGLVCAMVLITAAL